MRYPFINQVGLNITYISILFFSSFFCFACNQTPTNPPSVKHSTIQKAAPINNSNKSSISISQNSNPDTLRYCIANASLGAGGYDLVNYFTKNAAVLGASEYTAKYDGVNYFFISEDHQELFKENPAKYLPAYGGWCSMTLAMGRATQPTYDNFKIIDGKLHLFERTISINGQTLWVQDHESNANLAEKNYLDFQDDGVIRSE